VICIELDIDELIKKFAIMRKIPISQLDDFDQTLRQGLEAMKLGSDKIDFNRYMAIAKRKDARLLAKKQGVDIDGGTEGKAVQGEPGNEGND